MSLEADSHVVSNDLAPGSQTGATSPNRHRRKNSTTKKASTGTSTRTGTTKKAGRTVGVAAKKDALSVRFPSPLYARVVKLAEATDQSVNAVLEAGLHNYLNNYVKSDEYRRKAQEDLRRDYESRRAILARVTNEAQAPALAASTNTGDDEFSSERVTPTMVRVDSELTQALDDLKAAFGVTASEIVIQATTRWVKRYPSSERFTERARDALAAHVHNLIDLGREDLLKELAPMLVACECEGCTLAKDDD